MKKKFLSLALAAVMLTGCGGTAKQEDAPNEQFFIRNDRNTYDNGCIYSFRDMNGSMSYYLDYDSLECSSLCAVPNCDHTTSSCSAREIGACPLLYNDYIYYFVSDCGIKEEKDSRDFYINSKLMKMKLDSSETETVTEFHDCNPDTHDGFVVNNGVLYFQADDMNPQENEYGAITYSEAGGNHFLCSIDLRTGKYTNYGSIYDGDKQYDAAGSSSGATIYGVNNGKIVIDYSFLKEDIPEEKFMEEGFSMGAQFTNVVVNFDLNSKTYEETDLQEPAYVDNDIYVYNDRANKIIGIVENGSERKLENNSTGLHSLVLNGKLWTYDENEVWYDLSDLSEHRSTAYTQMMDYYNGCYIVKKLGMSFEKLTEEELLSL